MTSRHNGSARRSEDRLALLQRCPLCHGAFEQQEMVVLEADRSHKTIHIECPLCHVSILAMVVSSQAGSGLVATVTDLSANDATLLMRTAPLCGDDLLSCHALLKHPGALEQHMWSAHQSSMIS